MKTIKLFLLGLITIFTLNSCMTAYAQYDDECYYENGVDYMTVVTYGTPYYVDGVISYYLYHNLYYYPYMWDNIWYFRPFLHPQPHGFIFEPGRYFRPNTRLGDMAHRHQNPNFGNSHRDMGQMNRGGYNSHNIDRNNGNVRDERGGTSHPQGQSSTRVTVREGNKGQMSQRQSTQSVNRESMSRGGQTFRGTGGSRGSFSSGSTTRGGSHSAGSQSGGRRR